MAWSTVSNYRLGYSVVSKQFLFYFELENESSVRQLFVSAEELLALADMFRNEGPVSYNSDGNYFVTGAEPVGEGEPVLLSSNVALPLRTDAPGSA
jgi:hypothetical protein